MSEAQWQTVQNYIQKGIDEGACLVAGGPGKPEGLTDGFYARPTIFADVTPDMTIAREEIFGPVLVILTYQTVDQAIEIANDSPMACRAVSRVPTSARRGQWLKDCERARSI